MIFHQKIVLFISFLLSLIVYIDISAVEFMLPRIAVSLNANLEQAGLLISIYLIGLCGAAIPAGYIGDLTSRKWVYIFGMVLFALFSLLLSFSTTAYEAIIFRLGQGISGGIMSAVGMAYIALYFGEDRKKAFTVTASSIGLGYLISPSLGGWFVGASGWYLIFVHGLRLTPKRHTPLMEIDMYFFKVQ